MNKYIFTAAVVLLFTTGCQLTTVVQEEPHDSIVNVPSTTQDVAIPNDIASYINGYASMIEVSQPPAGTIVTSTLLLEGQAIGPWFFEATMPVLLADWDGQIIAQSYVTAQTDWMTTDKVPFSGTLSFTNPYPTSTNPTFANATLIFQKSNPSGLPANDDALEIPVLLY